MSNNTESHESFEKSIDDAVKSEQEVLGITETPVVIEVPEVETR
jgi:hypothetical protein